MKVRHILGVYDGKILLKFSVISLKFFVFSLKFFDISLKFFEISMFWTAFGS